MLAAAQARLCAEAKTMVRTTVAIMALVGLSAPTVALSQVGQGAGLGVGSAAPSTPPLLWIRRPDAEDMNRAYPEAARRSGVSGYATMSCKATTEGRLSSCSILAESPPDYGFGAATLSLVPDFRVKPQTPGTPIEGATVVIPIRFIAPRL